MKIVGRVVLFCYCALEIFLFLILFFYGRSLSYGILYVIYFFIEISIVLFFTLYWLEKTILKMWQRYEESKKILTPEDFLYYREKLVGLSPAEMQLLLFRKINFEDAIIASYLSLELRGYVKIVGNEIIPLDKDVSSLSNHEKSLLSSPHVAFNKMMFGKHFKNMVIQDCVDKHYLEEIKFTKDFPIFTYVVFFIVYFFFLVIGLSGYASLNGMIKLIANIDMILPFFIIWFSTIYSIGDSMVLKTKRKLSNEGILMCQKIEGLKRYFKDFSILAERSYKEVILWEDYLIYAIIFNKKGNLNDEMKEKFKMLEAVAWYNLNVLNMSNNE